MRRSGRHGKSAQGFTLIEVICVVVILAILIQLAFPAYKRILDKAHSVACGSNLRQLGIAVELASQDNDGEFPYIENDPNQPIYRPEDLPAGAQTYTLLEALQDYGIKETHLQCPADLRRNNRYAEMGSSYEWRPMLDGESTLSPLIYGRRGIRKVSPSRFRLIMDTDPVHRGRQNAVYADGHVRTY
ncbi:MAG: prepilin-type N-terminal cleavage/methylation domain-containing protein [Blastochloris sp.]|nr:prepilin-type N-terminal cleavage/methylation domain-containing protein [Blastochloris sp.]